MFLSQYVYVIHSLTNRLEDIFFINIIYEKKIRWCHFFIKIVKYNQILPQLKVNPTLNLTD